MGGGVGKCEDREQESVGLGGCLGGSMRLGSNKRKHDKKIIQNPNDIALV